MKIACAAFLMALAGPAGVAVASGGAEAPQPGGLYAPTATYESEPRVGPETSSEPSPPVAEAPAPVPALETPSELDAAPRSPSPSRARAAQKDDGESDSVVIDVPVPEDQLDPGARAAVAESSGLPQTGLELASLIAAGIALLAVGLGLLALTRQRRIRR